MQSIDSVSRRTFLAATSAIALARGASSKDRLKAGLVGCGGRGTQAAVNLLTGSDDVEIVALADLFEDKLEGSLNRLRNDTRFISRDAGITVERNGKPVQLTAEELVASIQSRIKVAPDRHFVGFDAFQKLINSDVDIVMLATPPGYRPQHFEAAINASKHVFTEKPIATDPVGVHRFMDSVKIAQAKCAFSALPRALRQRFRLLSCYEILPRLCSNSRKWSVASFIRTQPGTRFEQTRQ